MFLCRVDIPDLLDIPLIKEIAQRHNKSPAQILLKWILERGISAIPKSTNATRLQQNLDLFNWNLTADDMKAINALDRGIRVNTFDFFKGSVDDIIMLKFHIQLILITFIFMNN